MSSRFRPIAVLVGVFVLGGIAGAFGSRAYMLHELRARFGGPPGEVRAHLRLEAMRHKLDLKADQVVKIETIFRETDSDFEQTMKPCHDGIEALRKRTDERIFEVLEPAQRTRFKEHRRPHKRWPHRSFPRHPRPPPSP